MTLHYVYSDAVGSTIDITDRCRLYQLSVKTQAEEAATPISSLVVDDPLGEIEFTGHRRLYIYEDEAPYGGQVIYYGWTANERVARGPNRIGAGRQWTLDLADPNVLLNRRVMNGTDANRPAETDIERITALLTMTELDTISDTTYFNTGAAATAMDAVDYRGQNVGDYIDDCRQASGKNAYVYYSEGVGGWGLWYDFPHSTEYDSGCFLTTDESQEVDDIATFGYSVERSYLNRDPSRVASGIYLDWEGKPPVYVQDTDTRDAFTAIDWAAPSLNVKSSAKATARANRYLHDAKDEDEVIHVVMTHVPRASVNAIMAGQLVQFKAEYMPGYENYVSCRVMYRVVNEISEDPDAAFEIEMELTPLAPLVESYCAITWPRFGIGELGDSPPLGDPTGLMIFANSGDHNHAGCGQAATTGLLSKIATPLNNGGIWSGILVEGDGTVNIHWTTTLIWVHGGGTTYCRWSVMLNGVEIGFDSHLHPNGTNTHRGTVDLTGVSVVDGDIIEAYLTFSGASAPPTSFFSSPSGVGSCANVLTVGGSLS